MTFEDCVFEVYSNKELMAEYRRLTGSKLGLDNRPPIYKIVDKACGFDPHEKGWFPFFRFVRDCVWMPLITQEVNDIYNASLDAGHSSSGQDH